MDNLIFQMHNRSLLCIPRPHVHSNGKEHLKNEGKFILINPPYSSDLAHCDLCLLSELKKRLSAQTDQDNLGLSIWEMLNSIPKVDYTKNILS